jgi:uncharacterized membrane protein
MLNFLALFNVIFNEIYKKQFHENNLEKSHYKFAIILFNI